MNTEHLVALHTRLANEKARHADKAGTEWYVMYIAQIEKEIANERAFLGMPVDEVLPEMSDDELLAELA